MPCSGNSKEHCCIFGGVDCQYLEVDTIPGRHWVCGLMREHKDWDLVITDRRYIADVQPLYDKHNIDSNCRDWPSETCDCGG